MIKINCMQNNTPIIKIEYTQFANNSKSTFSPLLMKMLSEAVNRAQIQILFSNIDNALLQNWKQQYQSQKQEDFKINFINLEDQSIQIYQFAYQEKENKVFSNCSFLLLHYYYFKNIQNLAKRNLIDVWVDGANQRYLFKSIKDDKQSLLKFFKTVKKDLDSKVVLLQPAESNLENLKKLNCLNDIETKNKLNEILKVKQCIIGLYSQMKNIDNYNDSFLQASHQDLIKQNWLYCIIDGSESQQSNFDNFFCSGQYINLIKKIEKLEFNFKIELEQLNQYQIQFDQQYKTFRLDFKDLGFDPIASKHIIQIQIDYWIPFKKQFDNETHTKILQAISDLFIKTETKVIKNSQAKFWKYFLSNKYKKITSKSSVFLKEIIEKKDIQIVLKGQVNQLKIISQSIDDDLTLNYTSLKITIKIKDADILFILNQRANSQSNCLKNSLTEMEKKIMGDVKIKLKKVNYKESEIKFLIYCQKTIKQEIIDTHVNQFYGQMAKITEQIDLKRFLKFTGDDSIENLEIKFNVLYSEKDNMLLFCGSQQFIQTLNKQIEQFKKKEEGEYQTIFIDIEQKMIWNKIEKTRNSLNLKKFCQISFEQMQQRVIIRGPIEEIKETHEYLLEQKKQLEQSIYSQDSELNHSQINFLRKKQSQKLNDISEQYNCEISNKTIYEDKKNKYLIEFNQQQLILVQGDIINIEVDAIVNCCNSQLNFYLTSQCLVGKIAKAAGLQFQNECSEYIKQYKIIQLGEVFVTNSYEIKKCQSIINVCCLNYQQEGLVNFDELKLIQKCITNIFKNAEEKKFTSLAIPIIGGYVFKDNLKILMDSICFQMTESQFIKTVYIIENDEEKISYISNIFQELIKSEIKLYEVKYQWQWKGDNGFINYEDWEINKQIDIAYHQFLQNPSQNEFIIKFPFTKVPGTHFIDLDLNILYDFHLNKDYSVYYLQDQGKKRYYFDREVQDDSLTEYISQQQAEGINQFQLFLKFYKIQIKSPDEIYQVNAKTNYQRKIQKVDLKVNQNEQFQNLIKNALKGKEIKSKNFSQEIVKKSSNLTVKGLDKASVQQCINDLRQLCLNSIENQNFQLPRVQGEEFQQLIKMIQNYSVEIIGKLQQGEQISVKSFKSQLYKISTKLQKIQQQEDIFPLTWIPQTENFIKVTLQNTDLEYQKIDQQFHLTHKNGKILQIARIQNKQQYRNYFIEKTAMINRNIQRGRQLTELEKERLVWHGTKYAHPKIIYSGIQEAFDNTYSNPECMWGMGIYFAENSLYSVDYTYTLKKEEEPIFEGKKVFLCCQIATGIIHNCKSNPSLRRPPLIDPQEPNQGLFDCVSGETNNSIVYILYQMDVRRAYPAYEVIFE